MDSSPLMPFLSLHNKGLAVSVAAAAVVELSALSKALVGPVIEWHCSCQAIMCVLAGLLLLVVNNRLLLYCLY